jgi:hypothetical protein
VRTAMRSSSVSLRAGQADEMPSLDGLRRQATVDVIMASSSVPRPVRRRGVSQSSRFVQVEVNRWTAPGKLGTLVPGQSEGPKKERQSGVVKVDSRLRGKVH